MPSVTPNRAATPAAAKSDLDEPFFKKISAKPATPGQPVQKPATPTPVPAARTQAAPFTQPELPRAITPTMPMAPIAPTKPVAAPAPVAAPKPVAPIAPISPIAPVAPAAPAVAAAQITPIAPEVAPEPAPIPFQAPPVPVVQPATPAETRFLMVSIADLSPSWPEAVQHEIAANHLSGMSVGLPFGVIELAMKQGKIAVPWRIVRSWIKPQVVASSSAHDAMVLDLPLKVVAPLFLAEIKGPKAQKKIQIDENIPDLFSGGRPAEAPAPIPQVQVASAPASAPSPAVLPSAKPADTNYFTRKPGEDAPEEPAPVVKKGPTPGTAFLVRYATPNEIVSKAAALDGVDGALIALPDGLLVASHIPPTMNGDTIAAFLPQIFSRVSQCTKELRLGELNNLNFTVGAIPWKIFKVGAIYFAAFGRPGEPLPTAQLAGIAAELDRKAK